MSIRLRLTLLYTGILALTLLTFSVILYVTVVNATREVLADGLQADLNRLTDAKDFKITNVAYTPAAKGATTPYIETLDLSGKQLSRTVNANYEGIELTPLTNAELQQVRDGKPLYSENTLGSDRWLVYSKRAKEATPPGIVRVARPIEESIASLSALRRYLIIGGLIAVGLAFLIGFFLARTALQPIGRITATARTIETSRDFGRRVDHHGPEDEVGQLSTTLNAMLAALQMAYQQTEGALQAQRRFIADASHELRTPLTTIRGNLGLLGRAPPIGDSDRRAVLRDMVEEAERMSRLIDNLLALARADSGLPFRVIPVPIDVLIADACRQTRLSAPQRTISCSSGPAAALGDPDALKQTLLILLDNAIKHTPSEALIQVTGDATPSDVTITVRDSGPGIAPSLQSQIFERFFRADVARTGDGAGLGLSIARALIEGQSGRIEMRSELGQGSTFTVTLPRNAPDLSVSPVSDE